MSHTAYLRIKDKEYLLISCDYEFVQSMGWNGQPAGRPTGGLIHLILVSPDNEDTFFHDWLQDTMESKDGSIAFTADKAGIPLPKTLCFRDAYCIHLVEYFDGRLPMQMVTKITISAAEIDFCNKNVFKNIQPKNSSYVIAAGDNLSTIAKNHGVSVNQLAKWNNISDVNTIYAGDTLKVRESDSYSERGSVGMGKFDARPKWGVDKFDTRPILQSSKENWYDRKKAEKFDNRSYLERNPEMKKYFDVTDMVLTGISSVAGAKLSFSNYQYLSSLANNNKFLGMKYGKLVVMDNSYLSTKRMRLTLGPQKADFLRNVKGLRYIKGIGWIAGGLSAFYSGYKFFFEEQNWENGIGFGVGLGSFAFWEIGAIYGMGRMYIDSSAEQMRLFEEAKKVATPKEKFWINVWQSAGSPAVRYY